MKNQADEKYYMSDYELESDLDDDYDEDPIEDEIEDPIEEPVDKDPAVEITKKDASEIMATYNDGKVLVKAAEEQLKELFHLGPKEKITTAMLFGKAPKGISKEDFKELVQSYNTGMDLMKKGKEEMVAKLDMFIYYVIERQFNTFKKYTRDLYQEGVVGILKGIDTYKPQKSKPTTFFYIYIVHEMTEFINLNINKTTSHYSANIIKVKKAINHFEREGREWTIKDIAQETGISAETIAQAINIMEVSNEVHYDTVDYLDSQMSQRSQSPEEEFFKEETSRMIQAAIDTLPKDEADVIRLKYGLSGEEPLSYKNISSRLGIQIDKVKKLNSSGLRKLKRSKIISGNFKNLQREEKALNSSLIGVIPLADADKMMDDLDALFEEDEKEKRA